jgi:hypothetical protein
LTAAGRDPIDDLLGLDLGGRGIGSFFVPRGAARAAQALGGARRVLVVTGFCVPPGLPETDGPPGAAVLGRALRRLGAEVRYLTDPPVRPVLAAALETLGEPRDIEAGPAADGPAATLARLQPTHLVAIERPGRGRSGDYLSARGESVAAWNSPLDALFLSWSGGREAGRLRGWAASGAARRRASRRGETRITRRPIDRRPTAPRPIPRRPVTIAIGDGGNEIGMGNVRARLARRGGLLARIASVVRVDHLVVAAVSNWGAYGVAAALGRGARRDLLHTPEEEARLLEACVAAGAVDGVTRRGEPTVDRLPLATHAAVLTLLRRAAASGMMDPP